MTAYFRYEIRRNLLPLAVFTAISCLLCAISAMTTRILSYPAGGPQHAVSAALEAPAIILGVLCTLVPVLQFSFRMNKRSADLWYSLPIRREKLLLGRIIGTCLLIFVPFTTGYWLQFAILMCRENAFTAVHFLLLRVSARRRRPHRHQLLYFFPRQYRLGRAPVPVRLEFPARHTLLYPQYLYQRTMEIR